MIQLKSGLEIKYNQDFDVFFKNIMESVIFESQKAARSNVQTEEKKQNTIEFNDLFLKEIMDNCIFITHQLFELYKDNEEISKFIVTGFIFNTILLTLPQIDIDTLIKKNTEEKDVIH